MSVLADGVFQNIKGEWVHLASLVGGYLRAHKEPRHRGRGGPAGIRARNV